MSIEQYPPRQPFFRGKHRHYGKSRMRSLIISAIVIAGACYLLIPLVSST